MNELTYWTTLAFIQGITVKRKNEIYVKCWEHSPRISIEQLFQDSSVWEGIGLTPEECEIFANSRNNLANNSFLVEDLLSQGYNIIPITSQDYSKTLKNNLGTISPTVLFSKGNLYLLQEPAAAIVGSRNADTISLQFTSEMAKRCVSDGKVVVSGFAKGVDKMALDAALEAGGKSIIVLPQGITTFASGFKQYYKYILQGRLLVVSMFYPNAPWSAEFAMRRNPYIYGLADEIYVAQSDEKGDTWSGVIDGLRKKRTIYVRKPNVSEKNANILLIQKGAIAVDNQGIPIPVATEEMLTQEERSRQLLVTQIKSILSTSGELTSKAILEKTSINWSDKKMKEFLRDLPCREFIEEHKDKNRILFRIKGTTNQSEIKFD